MDPADGTNHAEPSPGHTRWRTVGVVFVFLTLLLIASQSAGAAAVLLRDGSWAVLLLVGACGWGVWPAAALGLERAGRAWVLLTATALGLGLLAVAALALGCAGVFAPVVWWCVLVVGKILGVTYVALRGRQLFSATRRHLDRWAWLILLVAPFLALGVLSAATPPGVLWAEEGFGYDVLEYHLALPAEYLRAGRISYLPHNVYANFPANVEMLFLWTVVLRGDPWEAVFSAKMLNLLLGVLAVGGVWLAGREVSPRAALPAALLAGGSGWLVYLSGVAYVENGMLLFAALGLAATLRAVKAPSPAAWRWALLAGLQAGLACGCKYSAIGLVAAPLLAVWLVEALRHPGRRFAIVAGFVGGSVAACSPWLIKNAVLTGDPLFPLGKQIFADYPPGWDAERSTHFRECHSPQPAEADLGGRLDGFRRRVLVDPDQRIGTWLWLLAGAAAVFAWKDRQARMLCLVLGTQVLVWLFASHLYARFAVPMLIPLALLGAGVVSVCGTPRRAGFFVVLVASGLAFNLYHAARLYAVHLYPGGKHVPVHGLERLFTEGDWPGQQHLAALNALPEDAKVLMVGDARTFYLRPENDYCVTFNRNPLAVFLGRHAHSVPSPERERRGPEALSIALLDWLSDRGYTHVFVNWAEIRRLRNSQYGFAPEITPGVFADLESAGLQRIQSFSVTEDRPPYGKLYRVPGK